MKDRRGLDEFDAAFPELYRAAFDAARRITGDRQAAEDAAIEASYRAAVRWTRIRDFATPWTIRVAANLAIDGSVRGRRRSRAGAPGPRATDPVDPEIRVDLVDALRRLPVRQREVVVLRYLADLSERDTAALLGIAPGSVKSHASRGLAALRAQLATAPTAAPPGGAP